MLFKVGQIVKRGQNIRGTNHFWEFVGAGPHFKIRHIKDSFSYPGRQMIFFENSGGLWIYSDYLVLASQRKSCI